MINGNPGKTPTWFEDAFGEVSDGRVVGRVTRPHVGVASAIRPWLDPGSGALTAIRPGQVKIETTVTGVTSSAGMRVSPQKAP